MAFIDFTNGEVLTADQMDTVMRQSVMRFADATARDTALSAVLAEGMMCYLDDTNEVLKYDGSSWGAIGGDITAVTAGTALTGGGTSGDVTLNVDETALTIAQSQVTNLTTDLAGKQDDVITTRGDLVVGNVIGNPARLGRGTADQVLTSNGTDLVWADASGGGAELIATQTRSSFSGTVTFSSIPQTYRELMLRLETTSSSNQYNIELEDNRNANPYGFYRISIGGVTTSTSLTSLGGVDSGAVFKLTNYTEDTVTGVIFNSFSKADSDYQHSTQGGGFGQSRGAGSTTSLDINISASATFRLELWGVN